MNSNDKIILNKIASGDQKAFEHLFFLYQPKLLLFLQGMTQDEELSRDIAQEIFLALWKNRTKLDNIESFSNYLYSMARYKVYDYFDHLLIEDQYADEMLQNNPSYNIDEELFAKELQRIINEEVEKLSHQRKEIYRMSRIQGLSNDEIAEKLNLNKRTVENHLTAALAIIRKVVYLVILMNINKPL